MHSAMQSSLSFSLRSQNVQVDSGQLARFEKFRSIVSYVVAFEQSSRSTTAKKGGNIRLVEDTTDKSRIDRRLEGRSMYRSPHDVFAAINLDSRCHKCKHLLPFRSKIVARSLRKKDESY